MIIEIAGLATPFRSGSLGIDDEVDGRSVCSFVVLDEAKDKELKKGQPVEIKDEHDNLVYAGFIDSVNGRPLSAAGQSDIYAINCVDNHYLSDKRVIAKAYESENAGDIVKDIVTEKLAAEGVTYTVDSIEDGPIVEEAIFNYTSCSRAIESLAGVADFWWEIDENKVLHFRGRESVSAPWELQPSDIVGIPVIVDGNSQYRNRQYIRGGKDITDPQAEVSVGDGEKRAFTVSFPIAKVPTVEVSVDGGAWTAQTVGIRGVEIDKEWYWSKGDNTVSQDDSETVLTSSDKVKTTYQGEFSIVILSQSNEAISYKETVEGTTGIVEHVHDDQNITGRATAFQIANAKLKRYSVEGKRLTFRTLKAGLSPGQLLKVNLPGQGIDGDELLITAVRTYDQGALLWHRVTAIEGPSEGGWARFFKAIADRAEIILVRENISESEILITVEQFSKTWTESENPNIFREVRPSATLYPGADTYAEFEEQNRVRFLAWYNNSTELGRKPYTQQSDDNTDLFTLTYISPWEANESITHLGWVGGSHATHNVDTGVIVDKQAYVKTKTESEAVQVEKTDTRWA